MADCKLISVSRASDKVETAASLMLMFFGKYTLEDFEKEVGCGDEVVLPNRALETITIDDADLDDFVIGKVAAMKFVAGRWFSNETYLFEKDDVLYIVEDEYENI